jgi:hypothetical protein
LAKLTPALKALAVFFEIDPFDISAAARMSPDRAPEKKADYARLISRLSRQECDEFLLKIASGEPGATAALRRKLLSFEKQDPVEQTNPRTFGELVQASQVLRQSEARRHAKQERMKHIAEMQALATREAQTWQQVEALLQEYSARNYDAATGLLSQLQQLSEFQGTQANFAVRVRELSGRFKSRTALIDRWKRRGWV